MNADDLTSTRRPRAPALAVALLAWAAACGRPSDPIAAARKTLDRCERSATAAVVRFDCFGFKAAVEEHEGLTPIELIDMYSTGLRELGKGAVSTPFAMELDGKRWEGFRFTSRPPSGLLPQPREGLIAASRLGDGVARLASCTTLEWFARSRCDGVAELLASTGPEPWRLRPGTPSFLGRVIEVPPGCEVQAGTEKRVDIRCGTEAAMTATVLGSRDDMASTVDVMREVLHRGGNVVADEEPRPCRIGGAEARCSVVSVGSGAGRIVSVLGAAVAHGEPVFAMCSQPAAISGVHPVCEGVIDFSLKELQP